MNASELRMGNCITFEKELIKVNFITAISIGWGRSNFAPIILDAFKPIPLTEEWLIKFGFSLVGDSFIMACHNSTFSGLIKITYSHELKTWDFTIGEIQLTYINYLHQLQNLYFTLTQTELEIK